MHRDGSGCFRQVICRPGRRLEDSATQAATSTTWPTPRLPRCSQRFCACACACACACTVDYHAPRGHHPRAASFTSTGTQLPAANHSAGSCFLATPNAAPGGTQPGHPSPTHAGNARRALTGHLQSPGEVLPPDLESVDHGAGSVTVTAVTRHACACWGTRDVNSR